MKWAERTVYLVLVTASVWASYDIYSSAQDLDVLVKGQARGCRYAQQDITTCEARLEWVLDKHLYCDDTIAMYEEQSNLWHENQDHSCEKEQDDWNACYYHSIFSRSVIKDYDTCANDRDACWSELDAL